MAQPGPSTRPLTSLPLLVLAGIAEALCPHCTEDMEFGGRWHTPIHSSVGRPLLSNTRSLANLAATCKDLYAIVNPILYHQPQTYPERRVGLLRTLVGRPDFARRVKVLRLDFDMGCQQCKDEDDETFVLDLAVRHGWSGEADLPEHHRRGEEKVDEDLPSNLLIATCPNLEKFSMGIGYGFDFAILRPKTLLHLKDVYITHSDTEMGTCLGELRELYLAAPYLETLTSNMTASVVVDDGRPLPLGNLRHVRLDSSAIASSCLRTLLRSCPQLESFSYEAGGACIGYVQFSADGLVKLLLRFAPRLKHLEVDFRDEDAWDDSDPDEHEDDDDDPKPEPGFASLSHLESLTIDPEVLGGWDEEHPVATLFPKSLRRLTVITDRLPAKLGGQDLKAFASTARTLLPDLTVITTQDRYGRSLSEKVQIS